MNRNLMRIFKNGYLDFHSEQQGTEFAKKKGIYPMHWYTQQTWAHHQPNIRHHDCQIGRANNVV